MNDGLVSCYFDCGRRLDPTANTTYRRVSGWERKVRVRATGTKGGSDISLRELGDEFACFTCIDKIRTA